MKVCVVFKSVVSLVDQTISIFDKSHINLEDRTRKYFILMISSNFSRSSFRFLKDLFGSHVLVLRYALTNIINDLVLLWLNADGTSEISTSGVFSEKLGTTDTASLSKEGMSLPPSGSLPSSYVMQKNTPSRPHRDLISSDLRRNDLKVSIASDLNIDDQFQFGTLTK